MERQTTETTPLFDRIAWRDPVSGRRLEPIVVARTPAGVPICGALRIEGTNTAYPIVDCVARLTPELARRHRDWLRLNGLDPVPSDDPAADFQEKATVDSFGWQWTWSGAMPSDADLKMRVAERVGVTPEHYRDKLTLDAGAGADDQSAYIAEQGGSVVSIDLSSAIDVVASRLRMNPRWVGIQGDVTRLPLQPDQFDRVYCDGVIQHTRDSVQTVRELVRVVKPGGHVLASHYIINTPGSALRRLQRKVTLGFYTFLRRRLSRTHRFKLLLTTGNLAALAYVPVLGWIVRRSGMALYYELMPDFRTTWINAFDYYGNHADQRLISPEEFFSDFEKTGRADLVVRQPGAVVARKRDA
jgi:ubiquinone/menaquinone biosynthesis C-methylase UbiE